MKNCINLRMLTFEVLMLEDLDNFKDKQMSSKQVSDDETSC